MRRKKGSEELADKTIGLVYILDLITGIALTVCITTMRLKLMQRERESNSTAAHPKPELLRSLDPEQ